MFSQVDQSFEQARLIFAAILDKDPDDLLGLPKLKRRYIESKKWLFPYFDDDGRLTMVIDGSERYNSLNELSSIYSSISDLAEKQANDKSISYSCFYTLFELIWNFLVKFEVGEVVSNRLKRNYSWSFLFGSESDQSFKEGMKLSKALRVYLEKTLSSESASEKIIDFASWIYSEFRSRLANMDAENVTISINPVDYLLSSAHTAGDWTSCHNIFEGYNDTHDRGGIHKMGCLSYLCDDCTIVGFSWRHLSDLRDTMSSFGCRSRRLFSLDLPLKLWRQYIHLDPRGSAFFGREFPSSKNLQFKYVRKLTAYLLMDITNAKSEKWLFKSFSDYNTKGEYEDDDSTNITGHFSHNGSWEYDDGVKAAIRLKDCPYPDCSVGSDTIPCIECGCSRDSGGNAQKLTCDDCDDTDVLCDDCGTSLAPDDVYWVDGVPYCEDCFHENYFYCYNCEECDEQNNAYTVNDELYCSDCYHRLFIECEECGEPIDRDLIVHTDDSYCVCQSCYEELYRQCEDCGVDVRLESVRNLDDRVLCYSCADKYELCSQCHTYTTDFVMEDGVPLCPRCV